MPDQLTYVGDDLPTTVNGTSLIASQFAPEQPDFRTNGFDWLDFDMPGLSADSYQSQPHEMTSPIGHTFWSDMSSLPSSSNPNPTLHPIAPQQTASQPWPFDHTLDATPNRYILPPLREVLQSTRRPGRSAKDSRLDSLVQLLSGQRLPSFGSLHESGSAEAFGDFQRLLDLYFTRFHDVQSIVHKPTWNQASCPTVLLTAMACVGALLSDEPGDADLSTALSDICMPMAIWMVGFNIPGHLLRFADRWQGASDGRHYQDISYLNALCLHQIYSLGSGNRQLYQNADRSRGTLICGLRGIGLLSSNWAEAPKLSRNGTERDAHEQRYEVLDDDRSSTLAHEWNTWIIQEQERRAAWAAFEYDCSLCTLTSRRGAVDLGELPQQLPCMEALWDATSAHAWLALRSRLDENSVSPRLSAVLKAASSTADGAVGNTHQQLTLGSWAKRLCAQVVGRLLWDLKQLEIVTMPEHLGLLSSLQSAQQKSKQELLDTLRNLFALTASPSSTSELITYK